MAKALPRGIRNRNPGNIERESDRWLGMSADQSSDSLKTSRVVRVGS